MAVESSALLKLTMLWMLLSSFSGFVRADTGVSNAPPDLVVRSCRSEFDGGGLGDPVPAIEVMSLVNDMLPMLVSSAVRSSASLESTGSFLIGDEGSPSLGPNGSLHGGRLFSSSFGRLIFWHAARIIYGLYNYFVETLTMRLNLNFEPKTK